MNDSRHFQHCWTVVWVVPVQFVGWAQQAACGNKICAKADEQRSKGIPHCYLNQAQGTARKDPNFISNIITCDKTCVFGYEPKTQQSSQQKTPTALRPNKVHSNLQSVLICWIWFYFNVLSQPRENIWHKRPWSWPKCPTTAFRSLSCSQQLPYNLSHQVTHHNNLKHLYVN
jgi:hypothetical protein